MTAVVLPSQALQPLSARVERERAEIGAGEPDAAALQALLGPALHEPLRDYLARPGKEFRARLCERAFRIAGGAAHGLPAELPLALEALHAGSLIVDDIEDGSQDRRGGPALHRQVGTPVALNAGNWLYFWPQRLVAKSGLSGRVRLQLLERMGDCLLACHEGQALDLTLRVSGLAQAQVPNAMRALGERKTGALMGLSAAFGAVAAGSTEAHLDALERFGRALGVGLQMLDDLSGVLNPTRAHKGTEDLRNDRITWVWAWLAEDLDAGPYAELMLARDQAVGASEADAGAELDALLDALRFRLGVTGPRRVRRHLEQALEALCEQVDAGTHKHELQQELRWLERRFLEGGA
jgi:geranylgeranyl pyrophosphate synthase